MNNRTPPPDSKGVATVRKFATFEAFASQVLSDSLLLAYSYFAYSEAPPPNWGERVSEKLDRNKRNGHYMRNRKCWNALDCALTEKYAYGIAWLPPGVAWFRNQGLVHTDEFRMLDTRVGTSKHTPSLTLHLWMRPHLKSLYSFDFQVGPLEKQ